MVMTEPPSSSIGASAQPGAGAGPSSAASASAFGPAPMTGSTGVAEALACVLCRSRKLKCDRTKPACNRCTKLNADCVYPESRRKPAFKRRNVKELEARLAHVEDMLKDAAMGRGKGSVGGDDASPDREASDGSPVGVDRDKDMKVPNAADAGQASGHQPYASAGTATGTAGGAAPVGDLWQDFDGMEFVSTDKSDHMDFNLDETLPGFFSDLGADPVQVPEMDFFGTELIGLNMFETLPPFEVIENLHNAFFQRQHYFIPLVHPGRYLQAFHSAPHMRPPMCLQYAIWAMAANEHEKYASYHDAFYRRARQYLEADEVKGEGEHFITVAHAQAWILVGTYEARCLKFTRAAMSCARAVRLCHMMSLHRLDDPAGNDNVAPTILPPQSWVELEERRRTFWGAFCVDAHASISTGWPSLIDPSLVTTHLPSSEDAFVLCREERTRPLSEIFSGAPYSNFAGAVGICHIFNQILAHVNNEGPQDKPGDVQFGRYWSRHREIDNILSNAFMFLPEKLRLPDNIHNPVSVHTNLNLHASVICLHMAACDRAEAHGLPDEVSRTSRQRLLMSAEEICTIMRLTMQVSLGYRSPLVALALYCAVTVYISQIKRDSTDRRRTPSSSSSPSCSTSPHSSNPSPPTATSTAASSSAYHDSLEFLIKCMESIGRIHAITRAFLRQTVLDLEHAGIEVGLRIPILRRQDLPNCGHNIPLLARTSVSSHTKIQPPLPGYLPLGRPIGKAHGWSTDTAWQCGVSEIVQLAEEGGNCGGGCALVAAGGTDGNEGGPKSSSNKRRRTAMDDPLQGTNDVTMHSWTTGSDGLPTIVRASSLNRVAADEAAYSSSASSSFSSASASALLRAQTRRGAGLNEAGLQPTSGGGGGNSSSSSSGISRNPVLLPTVSPSQVTLPHRIGSPAAAAAATVSNSSSSPGVTTRDTPPSGSSTSPPPAAVTMAGVSTGTGMVPSGARPSAAAPQQDGDMFLGLWPTGSDGIIGGGGGGGAVDGLDMDAFVRAAEATQAAVGPSSNGGGGSGGGVDEDGFDSPSSPSRQNLWSSFF